MTDDKRMARLLETLGSGDLEEATRQALADCWEQFKGHGESAMAAYKLDRAGAFTWEWPILEFTIERHGAIVGGGSSRAELQRWRLDLEKRSADVISLSHRQVRTMAPALQFDKVVSELIDALRDRGQATWLRWDEAGGVTVVISQLRVRAETLQKNPSRSKATTDSRTLQLREVAKREMVALGWRFAGRNHYTPNR